MYNSNYLSTLRQIQNDPNNATRILLSLLRVRNSYGLFTLALLSQPKTHWPLSLQGENEFPFFILVIIILYTSLILEMEGQGVGLAWVPVARYYSIACLSCKLYTYILYNRQISAHFRRSIAGLSRCGVFQSLIVLFYVTFLLLAFANVPQNCCE